MSAASSSSGSAERPVNVSARSSGAEESATSFRSGEQAATPSDFKISSIPDVQRWLALDPMASYSTSDLERIREVAAVLSSAKPR